MAKTKQNPKDQIKLRGKNGFKYTPKWAIIIPCDSEAAQQATYDDLKQQGYKCRVVNV